MKILVTGGTGFLGSALIEELLRKNHEVIVLTRKSSAQLGAVPYGVLSWPLRDQAEIDILNSCDAVINLVGESIATGRWNSAKKQKIKDSRIRFTHELLNLLRSGTKLKVLLSASAIGYYGNRNAEPLDESSSAGTGFLAEVCAEWEAAALSLKNTNLRTVLLRTGIVLSRGEGILGELDSLFKNNLGGTVGSGEQMMSWIHLEDWVRAVVFCLDNQNLSGPVNLVAPDAVNNRSFGLTLANLMHSSLQLPAPALLVQMALGEKACLALDSQNVGPKKLLENHFKFNFQFLREALENIYDYENQNRNVYDYFGTSTWVNAPLPDVFRFFSDAKNLKTITPPEMNFTMTNMSTEKIKTGTIIDYKLRVHGLPIKWRTEILNWAPPNKFTDTQLNGPYSRWHHTHTFEAFGAMTLMKDQVHYQLPAGRLGRMFGSSIVKSDVKKIFSYRAQIIHKTFNKR